MSKPPKEEGDESIQERKTFINAVAYISAGVALLLLLIVSIMIGIWSYRKSYRKKIERFVSLEVFTPFSLGFSKS